MNSNPPYKAEVLAAYNYYPFGMLQPGMYSENDNLRYRFGFNGMLRDDDMTDKLSTGPPVDEGRGNSYDFGARMYNPRVTRWFGLDPERQMYSSMSPYIYSLDNPVFFIDPNCKHAKVSFNGNKVTITCEIRLYGEFATSKNAERIQSDILKKWGGNHKYTKDNTEYSISIVSKVRLYDTEDPSKNSRGPLPDKFEKENGLLPKSTRMIEYAPAANFVKLSNNPDELSTRNNTQFISFVLNGNTGVWIQNPSLAKNVSPYAHEFGHLIGLRDNYEINTDWSKFPSWYFGDRKGWLNQLKNQGYYSIPKDWSNQDIMYQSNEKVTKQTINNLMDEVMFQRNSAEDKDSFILKGKRSD